MRKTYTAAGIAVRLWFITGILTGILVFILMFEPKHDEIHLVLLTIPFSLAFSFPAFLAMTIALFPIREFMKRTSSRIIFFLLLQMLICAGYGLLLATLNLFSSYDEPAGAPFLIAAIEHTLYLFTCNLIAIIVHLKPLISYFTRVDFSSASRQQILQQIFSPSFKPNINMENSHQSQLPEQGPGNKILYKGLITGGLILLMMIPTIFIINLVEEREARQKEVVKEVSSKWATQQTLSGPFLTVPYKTFFTDADGKKMVSTKNLVLLASTLTVNGDVQHEKRPRSIYKVLLYKTNVDFSGDFKIKFPADLDMANAAFADAKLCFALTDFKGIEQEVYVDFNGDKKLMSPGLPISELGQTGLSVPVELSAAMIAGSIPFNMKLKLKGSEQLHFLPLSANSKFIIHSAWPNPSFDGNTLPGERKIDEKGFSAEWNFNQANLPFRTVALAGELNSKDLAFGVSFVQPADQYDKTMRSVKYAILFIGLTFAFFFIIELMQKKPFHPVQYVLVGLALVIFYSLLLSISEYILFDYAYLVASLATVMLISLYAKGHFKSWGTAGIFFGLLASLYAFIFVLISLEDTALLVGSIGLFVVLALVMYASRKINWYSTQHAHVIPSHTPINE